MKLCMGMGKVLGACEVQSSPTAPRMELSSPQPITSKGMCCLLEIGVANRAALPRSSPGFPFPAGLQFPVLPPRSLAPRSCQAGAGHLV